MKIVHSAITLIGARNGENIQELQFRIQLKKDDWVLINQFRHIPVTVGVPIDPLDFIDIDQCHLYVRSTDPTSRKGKLVLTFNPGDMKKKEEENQDPYWETGTYIIQKKERTGDMLLREFERAIQLEFTKRFEEAGRHRRSYWEKKIEIDYRRKEEKQYQEL